MTTLKPVDKVAGAWVNECMPAWRSLVSHLGYGMSGDYQKIAALILSSSEQVRIVSELTRVFCDAAKKANPAFDEDKFRNFIQDELLKYGPRGAATNREIKRQDGPEEQPDTLTFVRSRLRMKGKSNSSPRITAIKCSYKEEDSKNRLTECNKNRSRGVKPLHYR